MRWLLMLSTLAALLLAGGCTAQDGGGSGPQRTERYAPTGGTGFGLPPSTPPGGGPAPTPAPPPPTGRATPAVDRLLNLGDAAEDRATFTATYRVRTAQGEVITSRLVQQPPRYRFEEVRDGRREVFIYDGRAMHACTPQRGRLRCSQAPSPFQDATLFGLGHPGTFLLQAQSLVTSLGRGLEARVVRRTVEGRALECAEFRSQAPGAPARLLCLNREGVVGYVEFDGNVMKLTSFTPRVRDEELVAPR